VNPAITFTRLGFVGIVTSTLFFIEHSIPIKSKIAQFMGRESLFIYVLHLVVLYGSPANDGLKYYFGKTQSLLFSIVVFILLFFCLAYVAILWHDLKAKRRILAINIQVFVAAVLLFLFLTRPY
jgi:fucose 4-O-acetylase-like acetyltransferase